MNVAAILCLTTLLGAQPAFEVASIKPHPIKEGFVRRAQSSTLQCPPFHCGISGNRFSEEMASLTDLIMDAYSVRRYQIGNLPEWGDSGHDVYDIVATAEGVPTMAQARAMLQTLLADRFQLKLHRQTKELPVFALVVAKNGPKLKPCADGSEPDEVSTFHRSWERIGELLSMNAGRPVIDKTGLDGIYCTSDGQDPAMVVMTEIGNASRKAGGGEGRTASPDESSLFSAVERKLGLKLEAQKAPVEILVIDHVERAAGN